MKIYNTKYYYVLSFSNSTYIVNKGGLQGLIVTSETSISKINDVYSLGMQPDELERQLVYHKIHGPEETEIVKTILLKMNEYKFKLQQLEYLISVEYNPIPVQGENLN